MILILIFAEALALYGLIGKSVPQQSLQYNVQSVNTVGLHS